MSLCTAFLYISSNQALPKCLGKLEDLTLIAPNRTSGDDGLFPEDHFQSLIILYSHMLAIFYDTKCADNGNINNSKATSVIYVKTITLFNACPFSLLTLLDALRGVSKWDGVNEES